LSGTAPAGSSARPRIPALPARCRRLGEEGPRHDALLAREAERLLPVLLDARLIVVDWGNRRGA
jgi:hypothetical protein